MASNIEGEVAISEAIKDNILILRMSGRLDAVSSPVAERKVFEYINKGHYTLLFDFTNVDYLSSAGLRMLLCVTKKLKVLNGKLVLCALSTGVMEILTMSGFNHVLIIAASEKEALQKF